MQKVYHFHNSMHVQAEGRFSLFISKIFHSVLEVEAVAIVFGVMQAVHDDKM